MTTPQYSMVNDNLPGPIMKNFGESEAAVVNEMFQRYATGTATLAGLAICGPPSNYVIT